LAAVVACSKNDDCNANGRWARAVTAKDNHHWPSTLEEFSACDAGCNQVVCATEALTISTPAALYWGHEDTAVHFENSKWVTKMFKQLQRFYHEPGKHVIHPKYEDKIVEWLEPHRQVGQLRRTRR